MDNLPIIFLGAFVLFILGTAFYTSVSADNFILVDVWSDVNGQDLNIQDMNSRTIEADKFFGDGSGLVNLPAISAGSCDNNADCTLIGTIDTAIDANFGTVGAGDLFVNGVQITGATSDAFDTTLDTNGEADLNWLGTEHSFTADQNFISVGASGNVYIDNNVYALDANIGGINIPQVYTATTEPTGFLNRTSSTLGFVDATRVFTITGTNFPVYVNGVEYLKNTENITVDDTTGTHWIYYAADGALSQATTLPSFNLPLIATIYYNTDGGFDKGALGEERHGITMDSTTHHLLHNTVGVRYESGLVGTFTNTTFGITEGKIDDEDLEHSIGAETTAKVFYKDGAADFIWTTEQAEYYHEVGGVLQYNNGNVLTNVTPANHVAYWVFATNDTTTPIYSLMGQRQDVTLANARLNNKYESLTLGTLPFEEMKLLYRVILKNAGGTTTYIETQDLRSVSNLPAGTYVATAHNVLTGLNWSQAGHTFDEDLNLGIYGLKAFGDSNLNTLSISSNLFVTKDINVTGSITAPYFFGDGSGLTNLPVDSDAFDTTLDNNVAAEGKFWTLLTGIFPLADANLWRYIPSEEDIDNNAIGWDTNAYTIGDFNKDYWSRYSTDLNTIIDIRAYGIDTNANTECDGNTVLTGDGTCQSITGFHNIGDGSVDSTLDNNAAAQAKYWEFTSSLFPVQDENLWRYIPSEADIDNNAIAVDTNANTECDNNTVLTGDGICQDITGFHVDTGGDAFDTTLDNNVAAEGKFWTLLSGIFPLQDANLWRYIPTEADIDNNAIGVDTNANTICDNNTVLTGTGVCQSIQDFHLRGGDAFDTTLDNNVAAEGKFWTLLSGIFPLADANLWRYIPNEADIDNNAIAWDTNANTECDNNTVLTGDGTCQDITGFHLDTQGDAFDTTLDNNAAAQAKFWSFIDLFFPVQDVNLWRYIPSELDIDNNAIAVDTNANTECDNNTVLTGDGLCQSIQGFHIDTSGTAFDTTLDNNALAQAKFWELLNVIIPWADVNVADDITLTNITQITNRSWSQLGNLDDLNTVIDIRTIAQDTNIADTTYQDVPDFNSQYWSKFDANAIVGVYVGSTSVEHAPNLSYLGTTGYRAATLLCDLNYENSHICNVQEMIRSVDLSENVTWTGTSWAAGGNPGYTANANDCVGYTSTTGTYLASFWDFDTNTSSLTACSGSKSLACCR